MRTQTQSELKVKGNLFINNKSTKEKKRKQNNNTVHLVPSQNRKAVPDVSASRLVNEHLHWSTTNSTPAKIVHNL